MRLSSIRRASVNVPRAPSTASPEFRKSGESRQCLHASRKARSRFGQGERLLCSMRPPIHADEMILMDTRVDLTVPKGTATDLVGTSISLDRQQVPALEPQAFQFAIVDLDLVNL